MTRLYSGEWFDVWFLHDRLEEEGIPSAILNETIGAAAGALPVTYPELWLGREEDLERASALVLQYLTEKKSRHDPRRDPEAKCAECGYLLYKLPLRRCPECGTVF